MKTRPYLIMCSNYNPKSGGQKALWQLAHQLNKAGMEAWVLGDVEPCEWERPDLSVLYADVRRVKKLLGRDGGVVVYPDVTKGNPLEAKRVVRWLLTRPGAAMNAVGEFWAPGEVPGERVYPYRSVFAEDLPYDVDVRGELFLQTFEPFFKLPVAGSRRQQGGAYYRNKWYDEVPGTIEGMPDLTRMSWAGDPRHRRYMAAYLQRCPWLLCLDVQSYIMYDAGLCGCPTLLPENTIHTRAQYEAQRLGLLGVALGNGMDEWERACEDVADLGDGTNRVSREVERVRQEITAPQLRTFIADTQEW